MASFLYFVLFDPDDEDTEEGMQRVSEVLFHGSCFQTSANTLILQTSIDKASALSDLIGFGEDQGDRNYVGFVLRLNGSYAGYYEGELWDWLREVREEVVQAT